MFNKIKRIIVTGILNNNAELKSDLMEDYIANTYNNIITNQNFNQKDINIDKSLLVNCTVSDSKVSLTHNILKRSSIINNRGI
ncbi:hypothetical protein AAXE64_07595 [Priestia megaterium]